MQTAQPVTAPVAPPANAASGELATLTGAESGHRRRVYSYLNADENHLRGIIARYGGKLTETAVSSVLISLALKAAAELDYVLPSNLHGDSPENKSGPALHLHETPAPK